MTGTRAAGVAVALPSFDGAALIVALDAQRVARDLDWTQLAQAMTDQSYALNAELGDHAMCPGALLRTTKRGTMSCQYAMQLLRWLGRPPEHFLTGPVADVGDTTLPTAGPDRRLRWNLPRLGRALDERRRADGLTWGALGEIFGVSPSRLSNLRTARLADMDLVMRVTQWLRRPSADFIEPAGW
ncbi:hypothetical protein [Jatrophihabitans fulvus]